MATTDAYVRPLRPTSEDVLKLSVMDQLMPRRHMSYLLCFKHNVAMSPKSTIQHLQRGLAAALTEMPQFAGELRKAAGPRNELELYLGPESAVLFRTRENDADYDRLVESMAQEPLMADEDISIPVEQLQTETGIRAFGVQATLVKGGVLLATSIHHVLADAKGSELFFEAWAKHTAQGSHGRSLTIEPISEDASARWRLSYGPKGVKMDSFLELLGPNNIFTDAKVADRIVRSTWAISKESMQDLKDSVKAVSNMQVSSSDLMCALICRHVYKARCQLDTTESSWPSSIILYVTSDMRSRLEPPLAKNYLGNASVAVPVAVNLDALLADSQAEALSTIATSIKTAVDRFDTNSLRSRLGFYKSQPFYGSIVPQFQYYPGPNMLITDSSSMRFYSLHWGCNLHKMDNFRSIGQTHSVGQCTLNPKHRGETVELQIMHDLRVVDAMGRDKAFSQFFQLKGYY